MFSHFEGYVITLLKKILFQLQRRYEDWRSTASGLLITRVYGYAFATGLCGEQSRTCEAD